MKKNKLTDGNKEIALNYMIDLYNIYFYETTPLNKPILNHIINFIESFELESDKNSLINEALNLSSKDFTNVMKEKNLKLKQYEEGVRTYEHIKIPQTPCEFI